MSLIISPELHRAFKVATVTQGKEMSEVLIAFIEEYVHKYGPAVQAEERGPRMKERQKQKPAVDFSAEITSPEELLVFVHFLRSVYEQEWQRVGEALIALIEQYIDEHPTLRQPATNGGRA